MIQYFNRHTHQLETEQVYGQKFLEFTYGNPLGILALHAMVKRSFFSRWYGRRMDKPCSKNKIQPFLKTFPLKTEEFLLNTDQYKTFNEFFYRKLKPEARPIVADENAVVFPADGRHMGFSDISNIRSFFVKGQTFDLKQLLGSEELAEKYAKGTLVLSRLCPVDYHRYHFPCAGVASESRVINGPLYSVSPIALRKNLSYLWQNKRSITELVTEKLGTVLCLEIGATCVGSMHQTYQANAAVSKGQEKGYFSFGGSSTITIFEPNKIKLADDLLANTEKQIELFAQVGSLMGTIC